MVNAPVVRMGPLPRSLASEANDCFMVGVPADPTEYKYAAQGIAPSGRLPSVRITVVYSARPYCRATSIKGPVDQKKGCHGAHCEEGPVLAMLAQRALLVALFLSSPPLRAAALVEQGRDGKAVLNDLTEKAPYKFGPYRRHQNESPPLS